MTRAPRCAMGRGGSGDMFMTVVAMDTYEVVKELMAAGFTDEQA